MRAVDFEVIGKVQGVFFRKYTKKTCDKNKLTGWVLNTPHGSVQGHMEGGNEGIEKMKKWLKTTGSPKSRIDECKFFRESPIDQNTFSSFDIVRDDSEVRKRMF